MQQLKIIADNKIPYLKGVLEPFAHIEYCEPFGITHEKIKDADALIIRTRTRCDEQLLEDTKVKMIATATIGHDHIDKDYCNRKNIEWSNCPGCNAESVAQYIMSTLVLWCESKQRNLKGLKLGIVGLGNVGTRVEAFARRFEIEILRCDPPRALEEGGAGFVELEDLAKQADVITFHTPLTFDSAFATYKLGNAHVFSHLKGRDTLIINSARGGVIDEADLLDLLNDNPHCNAVIDCWKNEPDIDMELAHKAFIATPHIAGYSYDGKANATRMAVNNISRFFSFTPDLSLITPPAPSDRVISISDIVEKAIEKQEIAESMREIIAESLKEFASIEDIQFVGASCRERV